MLKTICIALGLCNALAGPAYTIDGDTVIVQGYHIRMAGLDCEELRDPHGLDAKRYMQALVRSNIVQCELNGERSYNRYVGTCRVNGHDLAERMVSAGMCLDCQHYSHGKYRSLEPANVRLKLKQAPYC